MQEEVGLMAYIGGFLGGGVEMVPAGYSQILMQWMTPDRLNLDVKFTIEGVGATLGKWVKQSTSDGRAEIVVPVGDYTISVDHNGLYMNDRPQRISTASTQTYFVLFGAEYQNMKKFVQRTEPLDADIGDIWVRTAE